MISKSRLDAILRLTDWFHGHWEDPEWGRMPVTQILIAVAIRELASAIRDKGLREQIHAATDTVIAKSSQVIERT
jgi:hypothetical protein